MGDEVKRSICELCTKAARKRCQRAMTRNCDRLLETYKMADIIGAKYHLFASGKCVLA